MSSIKDRLNSKKFIFALFSELILAAVVIIITMIQAVNWPVAAILAIPLIGIVIIPVGYVNGQAAIDKMTTMIQSITSIRKTKDD